MEREKAGLILILLGAAVWPLAYALKLTVYPKLNYIPDFLALHLLLIFSGLYLRGNTLMKRLRAEK